jgi:hypothetical protein
VTCFLGGDYLSPFEEQISTSFAILMSVLIDTKITKIGKDTKKLYIFASFVIFVYFVISLHLSLLYTQVKTQ